MNVMHQQVTDLLNIYAPSGKEKPVRDYLFPILLDLMDRATIDEYGNLLAEKRVGDGKGATVLLSAHMDTVKATNPDKVVTEENGYFKASLPNGEGAVLGADDRAGIAIVLEALRSIPVGFSGRIKVAFTVEEETGCNGSANMNQDFYRDADLAIVVDRKGNRDIVVGCFTAFCSDEVGEFMEDASDKAMTGFECTVGGVSDAVTFSENGIQSVNLSAGYYNEHTVNETLSFGEMKETVYLIVSALALINERYKSFGEVTKYNQWVMPNGMEEELWVMF